MEILRAAEPADPEPDAWRSITPIGGLNVASYHAFNIAVHILAALTLFGLVRRTLYIRPLAGRLPMIGKG